MARVDPKKKTIQGKIVYYGPALCGKTSNLEQINRTRAAGRELLSLSARGDRILLSDLLPIDPGPGGELATAFKVFTIPGQVQHNQTRKTVLRNVDGVVFVADSRAQMLGSNLESLRNLLANLSQLGIDPEEIPLVLQYNKRDLPTILPPEKLDATLNRKGYPVHLASAVRGEGVIETFDHICALVMERLKAQYTRSLPGQDPPENDGEARARRAGPVPNLDGAAGIDAGETGESAVPSTEGGADPAGEEGAEHEPEDELESTPGKAIRIRLSDLVQLPEEELQDQIQLADMMRQVARLVDSQLEVMARVEASTKVLGRLLGRELATRDDLAVLGQGLARIAVQVQQALVAAQDETMMARLTRMERSITRTEHHLDLLQEQLARYVGGTRATPAVGKTAAPVPGQAAPPSCDWIAEEMAARADKVQALHDKGGADQAALLELCHWLRETAAKIPVEKAPHPAGDGVRRAQQGPPKVGEGAAGGPAAQAPDESQQVEGDPVQQGRAGDPGSEESGPSQTEVTDLQRQNAARVARVMVADLYLYHREKIEEGIRCGDLHERCSDELRDMRATYEARINERVRSDKDYLKAAIDDLLQRVALAPGGG